MIRRLNLNNFKCFQNLSLPLNQLTLLTGVNASGKSTVLQSLALLHQTAMENEASNDLSLNGPLISLGSAGDVSDKLSSNRKLSIGLEGDSFECSWKMEIQDRSTLSIPIHEFSWKNDYKWNSSSNTNGEISFSHLVPTSQLHEAWTIKLKDSILGLTYLSADRWGPRETYPIATRSIYANVGSHGEKAPWILREYAEQEPINELIIEGESHRLDRQVEAWMNRFFANVNLEVTPVQNANLITLGMRSNVATSFHRPQNIGYGFTHVLPILTACLHAQKGRIIMVENPEAHLHPSGQAMMGQFLAICAASGIQILLETHSDHVLNGIRRSVKSQLLNSNQVAIHFFMQRNFQQDSEVVNITSPTIDSMGNLDHWPNGFFDQFDKDNAALINWG